MEVLSCLVLTKTKIDFFKSKCLKKFENYRGARFFPQSLFFGRTGRKVLSRVGNTDNHGLQFHRQAQRYVHDFFKETPIAIYMAY
jgi:hypothetical protein